MAYLVFVAFCLWLDQNSQLDVASLLSEAVFLQDDRMRVLLKATGKQAGKAAAKAAGGPTLPPKTAWEQFADLPQVWSILSL